MPDVQEIRYTVSGSWPFPVDMLRHDGARPASEADREAIERLSQEHAPDRDSIREKTSIELVLEGGLRPNTARWESFKWEVPDDHVHRWAVRERSDRVRREALRDSAYAKLTADEIEAVEWFLGGRS